MKKIFCGLFFFALVPLSPALAFVSGISGGPADPFYAVLSSTEHVRAHYGMGDLRVLIVPGHNKDFGGTAFGGVYERDLVLEIAHHLGDLLAADPKVKVYISRDRTGETNPLFKKYFDTNKNEIALFIAERWKSHTDKLLSGKIEKVVVVEHNNAPASVVHELYGLNKWSNENRIDIVLHIHINDHAGRKAGVRGVYTGFTIYAPEDQLKNSPPSFDLARYLKSALSAILPTSDLPGESTGIVPEQDLIAIGGKESRDSASLLIEYGYIYESGFQHAGVRKAYLHELARATHQGIENYLNARSEEVGIDKRELLPFVWSRDLFSGLIGQKDVLALQYALEREGLYPGAGKTLRECPMAGNFGPCTKEAVLRFQARYGVSTTGYVGPQTRATLNKLFK